MSTPSRVLIVDDNEANVDILRARLASQGYDVLTAGDGEQALGVAREHKPDLILLDIMMPKIDGIEVCRRIRGDESFPFIPIVVISAKSNPNDIVEALEAGADEYLTKPIEQTALVARVKSMLRIKRLHDTMTEQAEQLAEWNERLEKRVASQVKELDRLSQLKRFFSPQLAELLVSQDGQQLLESHRREITVLYCDLRQFTAFSSTTEPEEVMRVLGEYHRVVGSLVTTYEATLEHFAGDGIMLYFNDPVPCPDPAARAVRMAVDTRDQLAALVARWQKRGIELGFGVGVALGYATLGQIGFEGQFHYAAIGSVANLASRLCDMAENGQVLITQKVYAEVEDIAEVEPLGDFSLKGFFKPVPVLQVTSLKTESGKEAKA